MSLEHHQIITSPPKEGAHDHIPEPNPSPRNKVLAAMYLDNAAHKERQPAVIFPF